MIQVSNYLTKWFCLGPSSLVLSLSLSLQPNLDSSSTRPFRDADRDLLDPMDPLLVLDPRVVNTFPTDQIRTFRPIDDSLVLTRPGSTIGHLLLV